MLNKKDQEPVLALIRQQARSEKRRGLFVQLVGRPRRLSAFFDGLHGIYVQQGGAGKLGDFLAWVVQYVKDNPEKVFELILAIVTAII